MDMVYNTGTDWFSIINTILTLVFGSGFIISIITVRAQKRKANAEAKGADANAESTELDNVDKAVKIWRELGEAADVRAKAAEERAQGLYENYNKLATEVSLLRAEVKRLTLRSDRILKILDTIDHDNLDQKKKEAKEISNEKE